MTHSSAIPLTQQKWPQNSTKYKEVWGSYLIPRDIIHNPFIGPNCKCGVKFYNPTFFARQFGLTQMIPLPPFNSLNSEFTDRDIINDKSLSQKVKTKYFNKLEDFTFTPFQEMPYSTDFFDNWWCKRINSIQGRPLLDVLKHIISKQIASADQAEETSSSNTKISSRSEERRVGKECSEPCRSRWSPYH